MKARIEPDGTMVLRLSPVDDALAYAQFQKHLREHAPLRYEQKRAPAGRPTIIGGRTYVGGEFIPGDVMASATPEEKQELAEREHGEQHERHAVKSKYQIKQQKVDAGAAKQAAAMGLDLKSAEDFAEFVGFQPDQQIGKIDVFCEGPGLKRVKINIEGPFGRTIRSIYHDADGKLVMYNNYIELTKNKRGGGLGTRMFVHQVRNAINAGVSRIECEAAGDAASEIDMRARGKTGYYTGYRHWPTLGYDGPLEIQPDMPEYLQRANTVIDLLEMPGGEEWWAAHGKDFKATFDLTPGSRSRLVLTKYLMERAKKLFGDRPPLKFSRRGIANGEQQVYHEDAMSEPTKTDEPEPEFHNEFDFDEVDEAALAATWKHIREHGWDDMVDGF